MAIPTDNWLNGWVLHRRDYLESSLIVNFLTAEQGRFSAIARGAKRSRKGRAGLLQPFQRLRITTAGRSALPVVSNVECTEQSLAMPQIACGLYMNELTLRLMRDGDADPDYFQLYESTLYALAAGKPADSTLRQFELGLLGALGYGVDLLATAHGQEISPDRSYHYQMQSGWMPVDQPHEHDAVGNDAMQLDGSTILNLARHERGDLRQRSATRRFLQQLLLYHLDGKPVRSRELL